MNKKAHPAERKAKHPDRLAGQVLHNASSRKALWTPRFCEIELEFEDGPTLIEPEKFMSTLENNIVYSIQTVLNPKTISLWHYEPGSGQPKLMEKKICHYQK